MDTSDLQALLVVARKKSISQAAQAIHLTQSTLTTRLKKLENELGVLLLERSWKGVELTSHGNAALFHALKALKEMQALQKIDDVIDLLKSIDLLDNRGGEEHAGNSEFDQKIKIGITEPLGLSFFSPIAEELNCRFPNIKYDVLSEQEEFVIDAIALNEVHLGIVPYTRGRTDLVSIPMYKEELVMLLPKKEDVMFTGSYNDCPRLLDITCFLFYMCSPIRKLTDPVLIRLLGEMPHDIRQVNDFGTMLNLIGIGLGYTLIPSSFIYDTMSLFHSLYGYGNLPSILSHESVPFQIRRLGQTVPGRMIHMVYSASSPLARQLRTLSEQLVQPFSVVRFL